MLAETHLVSWLSPVEVSKYCPLKMLLRSVRQVSVRPPIAPYVGYKYPEARCRVPKHRAATVIMLIDPIAKLVSPS